MNIQELYAERCQCPEQFPDIWEHLPTLKHYASMVGHITEFGVRTGNSTTAFLAGLSKKGGTLNSYDIEQTPFMAPFVPGVTWTFTKADTMKLGGIAPTELLFLDSCHEYQHVLNELNLFAQYSSRYIIMHDTSSKWVGGDRVWKARDAFLHLNPQWQIEAHWDNCNGLTVLERIT